MAKELWNMYVKKGIVGCYQEYCVGNPEDLISKAFVHTINVQ